MKTTKYFYEYEYDNFYCYPNSHVLKNKLRVTNEKELEDAERKITFLKSAELNEKPLPGELNFDYLKAIHKYFFDDIYDWAGEIRKVDISKGNLFCQHELIKVNAEAIMNELKNENYLLNLREDIFIKKLAYYLGEINTLHPFREGNGRVQRQFIRELANRASIILNFERISQEEMIEASDQAFYKNYEPMEKLIARSILEDNSAMD